MSEKTVALDKAAETDKPAVEIKGSPAEQQPAAKPEVTPGIQKILDEAPAGLFDKSEPAGSRPERVTICKAHIDAFAGTIGAGQTDHQAVETATSGMSKMVGLLETMNASDVSKVLDHLMKSVVESVEAGRKAFDKGYMFGGLDGISGTVERQHFVRMMNMFTTYAKLRDKSKLGNRVSVAYSLEYVQNDAGRKAISAYFG